MIPFLLPNLFTKTNASLMKVPIIVLNVICWDWDQLLDPTIAFWKAWHGDFYDAFFMTTVAYFIVDLVWVCVFPKCVKSPSTIVQHHLAVLLYIMIMLNSG